MIDYSKLKPGDRLKIVGAGAPGFANLGDTVEVVSTNGTNRCDVRRSDGETAFFALTCGAARLEALSDGLLPGQDGPLNSPGITSKPSSGTTNQ